MKDFDRIALAVIRAKGIENASVQRIVAKDHLPYQKNEGGSGYKYKDTERMEYVVFLGTDKLKDGDVMKGKFNHEARGSNINRPGSRGLRRRGGRIGRTQRRRAAHPTKIVLGGPRQKPRMAGSGVRTRRRALRAITVSERRRSSPAGRRRRCIRGRTTGRIAGRTMAGPARGRLRRMCRIWWVGRHAAVGTGRTRREWRPRGRTRTARSGCVWINFRGWRRWRAGHRREPRMRRAAGCGEQRDAARERRSGHPERAGGAGFGGMDDAAGNGTERSGLSRPAGPWGSFEIIPCRDGKFRRVPGRAQPGIQPVADAGGDLRADVDAGWRQSDGSIHPLAQNAKGRVGLLRGAGNAIVAELAATFIRAAVASI